MKLRSRLLTLPFAAAWAFVLAFFLVSLADRYAPGQAFEPIDFATAIGAVAVLLFAAIVWSFSLFSPVEPRRFPHDEEPLVGCPHCHSQMRLLGAHSRQGSATLYLWTCEQDHGWSRVGASPADATHPWQPCTATEMMGVFFG